MRFSASLCAGLLALALSSGAAFAQSATSISVKDSGGNPVPVAGQQDAASKFHYRDVLEGLTPSAAPQAATIDATDGGLWAHITNWPTQFGISGQLPGFATTPAFTISGTLPAFSSTPAFTISGTLPAFAATPTVNLGTLNGAATAANQTAVQSAPGTSAPTAVTIQGNASSVAVPVSAASLPLPAGAATAANQATEIASASTTATNTGQTASSAATIATNTTGAAKDGTDATGVTPPTGGVGIRGWLSGIFNLLGPSGTLHTDLQTLNTTAGNPAKLNDSGGGDVSDATNHALVFEPAVNGRFVQAPVSITSTSATTLVAAQTSLYTYITDLDCSNHGQYTFTLTITNSTSTQLYSLDVAAGGSFVKSFATPIGGNGEMAIGSALTITASQTAGSGATPSLVCNVQGRVRSN